MSEDLGQGLGGGRLPEGHLREDGVERAGLQGIVQGYSDVMNGWSGMLEPDMASLLPDNDVTRALQRTDDPVARHSARKLHAASRGISSSLT